MKNGKTIQDNERKIVLAICYDFDKTLSPDDMQAQGFIQSVGFNVKEFWEKSNKLASDNEMDQNLAYMFTMIKTSIGKEFITRERLKKYGSEVQLFNGLEDWFRRINEYGIALGVLVEHYVISSGLREMIEGTRIAKEFRKIYASSYYFDETGVAQWPAQAINYTNKTQFLFRIEKGILEINDQAVNERVPEERIRVPFRNMVYIGDSDTDIPCMKLVNQYGGHSVGVFNPETGDKNKVFKMIRQNRIRFFAPADYSDGSDLDLLIKSIIDHTAENERLEDIHLKNRLEQESFNKSQDENEQEIVRVKNDGILDLESSLSFSNTHAVIDKIRKIDNWNTNEIEMLFDIGLKNSQIRYILDDLDVANFYRRLLNSTECKKDSEKAIEIEKLINS
jgi:hypothetical protein